MRDIARRTGLTPSTVSYCLNLLRLDYALLGKVETGEIASTKAIASVRDNRQQEREGNGQPLRGRPLAHFGSDHPLAALVSNTCTHRHSYDGIGCGPCWEKTIRNDAASGK